jgi:hypothetical protein
MGREAYMRESAQVVAGMEKPRPVQRRLFEL